MFPALQNGWDGFTDYMEFWNFVDWVSIVMVFDGIFLYDLIYMFSLFEV